MGPRALIGALLAAIGVTAGLAAQETGLTLRLRSDPGVVIHTIGWTELTLTITQSRADGGAPESVVVEVDELESLTRVGRGHGDGVSVLDVTYDSLRSRVRPEGGVWRTAPDTGVAPVAATLHADDRGRVVRLAVARPAPAEGARRLRDLVHRLALPLPEEAIRPADQWTTDVVWPFDVPVALVGMVPMPSLELRGWAAVALDSVLTLGADTLAFFRVDGVLAPPDPDNDVATALRIGGLHASLSGIMVWSTGWSAYVSGAARLLLSATILRAGGGGTGMDVSVDGLYRFQVRP